MGDFGDSQDSQVCTWGGTSTTGPGDGQGEELQPVLTALPLTLLMDEGTRVGCGRQRHRGFGETDQKLVNNDSAVFQQLFYLQPALGVLFMNTLIRGYESLNNINKSSLCICPYFL